MQHRVAAFIDWANTWGGIKEFLGAEHPDKTINYERWLTKLRRSGFLVGAYLYTGNFPDSVDLERQKKIEAGRRFNTYLSGLGFRIRTKKGKYSPDGVPKANCDIEIAVDLLRLVILGRVDVVMLFSGDGDYAYLLKTVQDFGVRVIVIGSKGRTAVELRGACDEFIALESFLADCLTERVERLRKDTAIEVATAENR